MSELYRALSLYQAGVTQYYPLFLPGAKTFFVAPSTYTAVGGVAASNGNDGESPQNPLATIAQAHTLAVSGRGDTICLLPGTYTLTATLAITKTAVRLVSLHPYAATITGDGVITSLITVNTGNDVEFAGLRIAGNAAATVNFITLGNTATIRGFHMHHCKIIGDETLAAVTAITVGENIAGTDALHTIIEDCEFEGVSASCITTFSGGTQIRRNSFNIDDTAGATGITIGDQGAAFGTVKAVFITDNMFTGQTDASALLAITVAGAEANTQMPMVARNYLGSLSGAHTQDRHPEGFVQNYVGGLTGGALIDPTVA